MSQQQCFTLMILVCLLCLYCPARAQSTADILDLMKRQGDSRVPPWKGTDDPVSIEVSMYVSSIQAESESSMDITADMYLRQFWDDPRLSYSGGPDSVMLVPQIAAGILWLPDIFFVNSRKVIQHDLLQESIGFSVSRDGSIKHSAKITVIFHCNMDLRSFPFDTQECPLIMETFFYKTDEMNLLWRGQDDDAVFVNTAASRSVFVLKGTKAQNLTLGKYPSVGVTFTLERITKHWILLVYVPSILLVLLACLVFCLPIWAHLERTILSSLLVVAMVPIVIGSQFASPQVGVVKALDVWVVVCFVFLAAAALTVVALHALQAARKNATEDNFELMEDNPQPLGQDPQMRAQRLVDPFLIGRISDVMRYAYPTVFVVFNAVYWAVVLN